MGTVEASLGQQRSPADPAGSGATLAALRRELHDGGLDLPLPGGGNTWKRWQALIRLAREDLSLARLAEGHTDAVAILAELGSHPPASGELWGVWAAHPPGHRLAARRLGGEWVLDGRKAFCSGAYSCTHALVTAEPTPGERRLFAVANEGTVVERDTWAAAGMAASETLTLVFHGVPAVQVGAADAYTARPGFHHGGAGVAACWYGGALGVAEPLASRARGRSPDTHTLAHFGTVVRDLRRAEDVLCRAAHGIDADPRDTEGSADERALLVRSAVAATCSSVLETCAESLGPGPFAFDPRYTRAAQDLSVYVRQHHGARDLARLGERAAQCTAGELRP
ncbi:acyl-CoA dehydrogenase [Nocardiopsis salina]|uniref:acyl-CoA dehydrogenase n=1 Tax=Nocardiopsis salina TaxID=245836 RepID=UPI000347561E|nr:acyl-CoA dehydrogenase [Nocardiopsis salina]